MTKKRSDYQREYRQNYQAQRVNLTLNRAEYRKFASAAKKQGQKPTTYIKELALASLENQALIPSEIAKELEVLRFAVLNIANNVNQIAHHSNTVKRLSEAEEHNLLGHLKQLDDVIRDYTSGQILSKRKTNDH